MWDIDDLEMLIMNNIGDMKHVVITGGEPLMQVIPLTFLLQKLKQHGLHITVETNGTVFDDEIMDYIDLISISPKLTNSIPWPQNLRNTGQEYYRPKALRHQRNRLNINAIQNLIDSRFVKKDRLGFPSLDAKNKKPGKDFQLKFVVAEYMDIEEIKVEILKYLKHFEPSDVILMPLGSNRESLNQNTQFAMAEAVKNGWRYTPRLHIDMFDDKRSV